MSYDITQLWSKRLVFFIFLSLIGIFLNIDLAKAASLSILEASTYIGGDGGDRIFDVEVKNDGTVYIVGKTNSINFPTEGTGYSKILSSDSSTDIIIAKLSSDLSTLLSSTYLGGESNEQAKALKISGDGSIFITGFTESVSFPTTNSAYDKTYNGFGREAFVSKFSSDLATLSASTYLGGTDTDEAKDITIDSSGSVYITGETSSTDFPTSFGVISSAYGGYTDGFITKLNDSLSSIIASTFINGTVGIDSLDSIVLGNDSSVIVSGNSNSKSFPTSQTIGYDTSFNSTYPNQSDAIVAKVSLDLTKLLGFTYLGGNGDDFATDVKVNSTGDIYVVGQTLSTNFPSTPSTYGLKGGFVAHLSPSLNQLNAITPTIIANGLAITSLGDIYVVGKIDISQSINIPIGGFDSSLGGNADGVILNYTPDLLGLISSTYLGGDNYDAGYNASISLSSDIYVVGWTQSNNFPVSINAYQKNHASDSGNEDSFVVKLNATPSGTPISKPILILDTLPSYDSGSKMVVTIEGEWLNITSKLKNQSGNEFAINTIAKNIIDGQTKVLYSIPTDLKTDMYSLVVRDTDDVIIAESKPFTIVQQQKNYLINLPKNSVMQGHLITVQVFPGVIAFDDLVSGKLTVQWLDSNGKLVYPKLASGPNPADGFSIYATYSYYMMFAPGTYYVQLIDTETSKIFQKKLVTITPRR